MPGGGFFYYIRLPCGLSAGKESARNAGDLGLIPGFGRSPGEGKGSPLQDSGPGDSMDCIVHGVAKSQTRLSDFHSFLSSETTCWPRRQGEPLLIFPLPCLPAAWPQIWVLSRETPFSTGWTKPSQPSDPTGEPQELESTREILEREGLRKITR